MPQKQSDFEWSLIAAGMFDTAIEWLLAALLIFMPLAFGVVHAWSEEVVLALSCALVICFLLKLLCCPNQSVVWNWAYVPISAFLLIVLIQLMPFRAGLMEIVSPNTTALNRELLSDLPGSDALCASMTVSFYPHATAHGLRLLAAIVTICAATVFVSLTRGGMISMLIAAGFTTLMLVSRKTLRRQGWLMVIVALAAFAAFACVVYVGFDETVARLQSTPLVGNSDLQRNYTETRG